MPENIFSQMKCNQRGSKTLNIPQDSAFVKIPSWKIPLLSVWVPHPSQPLPTVVASVAH